MTTATINNRVRWPKAGPRVHLAAEDQLCYLYAPHHKCLLVPTQSFFQALSKVEQLAAFNDPARMWSMDYYGSLPNPFLSKCYCRAPETSMRPPCIGHGFLEVLPFDLT